MTRTQQFALVIAMLLCTNAADAQDAGDKPSFHLSSTLPLYVGLPLESDVYDEARHNLLTGINWNVYFGGQFGIGVDLDFLVGGTDGLKVYGAFCALYHPFDIWEGEKSGMIDPFAGFGLGWTDAPGYYTSDGLNTSYVPVVEFTGAVMLGTNYWFSERFGVVAKTKFFFNRGFDFLQIEAGINIALFNFDILAGM